jgi:hypothetical protein
MFTATATTMATMMIGMSNNFLEAGNETWRRQREGWRGGKSGLVGTLEDDVTGDEADNEEHG